MAGWPNGHAEEAERVTRMIETRVEAPQSGTLPPPYTLDNEVEQHAWDLIVRFSAHPICIVCR